MLDEVVRIDGTGVTFFFLRIRRPPRSTRTDTLFPYTTLFRSKAILRRIDAGFQASAAAVFSMGEREPGRLAVSRLFRSEEHTSELQSLMRISYAVFCLKTKRADTRGATTKESVILTISSHQTPPRIMSTVHSTLVTVITD